MAREFEVSFPFVAEARRLFDPKIVTKAQQRTVTALKGKIATQISRSTREKFNVKAQRIKQALRVTTEENDGARSATLTYSGKRLSLITFGGRFRKVRTTGKRGHLKGRRLQRYGASAKVSKRGRAYVVPGGFIAAGASGNVHLYQRRDQSDPTSGLRLMTGPAVAQMVSNKDVTRDYTGTVNKEFPRLFESKLNHLLDKAK